MGKIQSQIDFSSIKSVSIECFGEVDDTKPIVLSFLIGLMQKSSDIKLNFSVYLLIKIFLVLKVVFIIFFV